MYFLYFIILCTLLFIFYIDNKKTKHLKVDGTKLVLEEPDNVLNYFEILPDELVLHIFGFLKNYEALLSYCPQVCKRWKRLSSDTSLWRNVHLMDKNIHVKKLTYIINLNFGMRRLEVISCIIKPNEFNYFQRFKNYFKVPNAIQHNNLQYLYLFDNNLSVDSLIYVLSNCFDLKEIHIFFQEINDIVCKYIARNESLTTLDLSCPRGGFSVSGISEIFKKCKHISNVKVFNQHFSEEDFIHVLDGVNSLSMKSMGICGNILDKHIKKITECCPNLAELDIKFCEDLTSLSLKYIVEGFPKLQSLSLDCTDFMPSPEIFLQLRCLRSLSNLEIFIYDEEPNFIYEIKKKLEDSSIHVNIHKLY